MTLNLFVFGAFDRDMADIFGAVTELLTTDLNFPHPIGPMDVIDIWCSICLMYMLADIAIGYFGWTGSDGDNR